MPPGRARLPTMPVPTASPAIAKTIGVAGVACPAAVIAAGPAVTMTSTLSRAISVAISAKRSLRPSVQRYSIATVRPSIQPSSRRRCTKAATRWLPVEGVATPKNPMVGSFPGCCARAASGHAAAAPPKQRDEFAPSHGAYPKAKDCGTKYSSVLERVSAKAPRSCPIGVKMRRTRIEHMSAGLPPITDITRRGRHGRKVPGSDICNAAKSFHSITSSARASSVGGASRPILAGIGVDSAA